MKIARSEACRPDPPRSSGGSRRRRRTTWLTERLFSRRRWLVLVTTWLHCSVGTPSLSLSLTDLITLSLYVNVNCISVRFGGRREGVVLNAGGWEIWRFLPEMTLLPFHRLVGGLCFGCMFLKFPGGTRVCIYLEKLYPKTPTENEMDLKLSISLSWKFSGTKYSKLSSNHFDLFKYVPKKIVLRAKWFFY